MPVAWLQKSIFQKKAQDEINRAHGLKKLPRFEPRCRGFAANYHELDKNKLTSGVQGGGPEELPPNQKFGCSEIMVYAQRIIETYKEGTQRGMGVDKCGVEEFRLLSPIFFRLLFKPFVHFATRSDTTL